MKANNTKWPVAALPILAVLIGFFGALIFKDGGYLPLLGQGSSTLELNARVKRLISDNEVLSQRVDELTQELLVYESAKYSGEEMTKLLETQLETLKIQAGLVAVSGEGVVIQLSNKGQGESLSLVSDDDILSIVNELNASGAEAISINGERVIATTEIRSAGEFISINARHYTAPFEIRCTGNANTLQAAMYLYGGVVERLSRWVDISVETRELIEVPAYRQRG